MGQEPKEPTRCPFCNSKDIETDLMSDEHEMDRELAVALGFNPDDWWDMMKHHMECFYMQAMGDCCRCNTTWLYGPRYYWNEEKGLYNLPRPLTPVEQIREENKRQEEAGQQRLFD